MSERTNKKRDRKCISRWLKPDAVVCRESDTYLIIVWWKHKVMGSLSEIIMSLYNVRETGHLIWGVSFLATVTATPHYLNLLTCKSVTW